MTCQKVQKIVSKSLVLNPSKWVYILCSAITAIYFSYFFVSVVHLRTLSHLSHTVLSCVVSCECEHYVHIFEQKCLMSLTCRWYWLLEIAYYRPEWLSGLWNCTDVFLRFSRFFLKSKKTWLFTFFWVVAHIFSNIVDYISCRRMEQTRPKVTAI